jgi:DNA-binding NarL/FixJ family response regulator
MPVEQALQLAFDEQAAVARESNDRAAQSPPTQPAQIERPTLPAGLTPRELDVLQLVARGLTNAQVAQQLIISPNTVSIHLYSIYSKLGVASRTAATRFAVDHRLVGPAS